MKTAYGCKKNDDRIGVLVSNLGTPDAPTKQALRKYLKQFLSDRRVIEVNPVLWWMILNLVILNIRPRKSAKLYAQVWTDDGSPLLSTTKKQAKLSKELLDSQGINLEFAVGMRYGNPSLESALDDLIARGCQKILLFPMYPQYSAATTGSTYDAVFSHLLKRRQIPTLKVVAPYFNRKSYINSLVERFNEFKRESSFKAEKLILSYHGVPVSYVDKGDPYCCQCVETSQYFKLAAGLNDDELVHTFQSRFGNEVWLNPYTDKTIEKLAKEGIKNLAVMCPAFTSDCLETLEEIAEEGKEIFHKNGGVNFSLIPCVNDHPAFISMMAEIIKEETDGWRTSDRFISACCECPVRTNAKLLVLE